MDIDMQALRLIEHERDLKIDVLIEAIEQALVSAYHRTPGAYPHARVEIDRRTGHVTVWAREAPAVDGDEPAAAATEQPEFDDTPEGFGRIAT
ncbi:MAG: transcription termination/antitermination protein NusA, partial [Micrococcales bacterium]|nr:transcription termination/antitermination protein NusA [Micrococcales bacterium]